MRLVVVYALALVAGCVSVHAQVESTPDAALTAVERARVRECPPDRVRADAFSAGEAQSNGVTGEDIGRVPLASDPTRVVRLRRLTIAPGGTIAWHDHRAVQGMALMIAGEMVETRNTCLDRMTYRAGDVAVEDAGTAHSWVNESSVEAVVLVAHVVAR